MDTLHTLDDGVYSLTQDQLLKLPQWYFYALLALIIEYYFLSGWFKLYPCVEWVDAGIYIDYSTNMENLVADYGFASDNYQSSRLGCLFLGRLMARIFGPVEGRCLFVAAYFFGGGCLWMCRGFCDGLYIYFRGLFIECTGRLESA